jgi:hypothetical protein
LIRRSGTDSPPGTMCFCFTICDRPSPPHDPSDPIWHCRACRIRKAALGTKARRPRRLAAGLPCRIISSACWTAQAAELGARQMSMAASAGLRSASTRWQRLPATARAVRRMRHHRGRAGYKLRAQTVEPVIGQIKTCLKMTRMSRRGFDAAAPRPLRNPLCATVWRARIPCRYWPSQRPRAGSPGAAVAK